ncbi:hypothetical protein PAPYR_2531 [Paratrimastix pyriformis]|uniref:Secreted protein n=1 Tax=Paratrimastix pyriformis TaxID=342808 RepID=A0ABQ8USM7_9EUKA|nr:hypothetical protein PAPYR_2531 [Paratrimastix pyriformis]
MLKYSLSHLFVPLFSVLPRLWLTIISLSTTDRTAPRYCWCSCSGRLSMVCDLPNSRVLAPPGEKNVLRPISLTKQRN